MSPQRRRWLARLAGVSAGVTVGVTVGMTASLRAAAQAVSGEPTDTVRRGRAISFPRDHGAHLAARIEWWYATGWLLPSEGAERINANPNANANANVNTAADNQNLLGFQITFFRSRTGLASTLPGRFAPRQLLFAHAAITDLAGGKHPHDQRLVRWSEAPDAATGAASVIDGAVHIGDWSLKRSAELSASRWRAQIAAKDFSIDLNLDTTQPPLLQGDAGFSRKGPQEQQASHYYSLPQLAAAGTLRLPGAQRPGPALAGRGWLDQEWSDQILHPDAVGWDWIGMNLFDGSALTAFELRRADGSTLWAGGSFRSGAQGAASRSFEPGEVQWTPGRIWRSPVTRANYPVQWAVRTPAGTFTVRSLADAQELDGRGSTGAIYWEGLSELLNAQGQRVGLGYLEMTGYAGRLQMG